MLALRVSLYFENVDCSLPRMMTSAGFKRGTLVGCNLGQSGVIGGATTAPNTTTTASSTLGSIGGTSTVATTFTKKQPNTVYFQANTNDYNAVIHYFARQAGSVTTYHKIYSKINPDLKFRIYKKDNLLMAIKSQLDPHAE